MTEKEIIKNLNQIKELADADCPKMASERITWLINDMTEEDYKYRQGRSKERVQASENMAFIGIIGCILFISSLCLVEAFMFAN